MDVTFYREILEASVPGLRVEQCKLHLGGWDSVALEVNDALIFRFPRPNRPDVEAQLEKERALLPELALALPLPIPVFDSIGDAPAGSGRRFVGYRKINGVELRGAVLAAADLEQIARQLAEFLSCLHAFPVARAIQLGLPATSAEDWRSRYQALYQEVAERIWPLLGAEERAAGAALWEGFLQRDEHFSFCPVLIHADLSSDHILYDAGRGTLAGIIDWGDARIGDPALDFVGLLSDYGLAFTERTLAAYRGEPDTTFWERVRFYQAIVPFYEVLYGFAEDSEEHIQRGLELTRQALAGQDSAC